MEISGGGSDRKPPRHSLCATDAVVLVHVTVEDTPIVPADKRIEVRKLGKGFFAVDIRHGFFETPEANSTKDRRFSGLP